MEQQSRDRFTPKAIAKRLSQAYAIPPSLTRRAIFREVYGDDYPEEVEPWSYVTMPLLRRIAQEVAVSPAKR